MKNARTSGTDVSVNTYARVAAGALPRTRQDAIRARRIQNTRDIHRSDTRGSFYGLLNLKHGIACHFQASHDPLTVVKTLINSSVGATP